MAKNSGKSEARTNDEEQLEVMLSRLVRMISEVRKRQSAITHDHGVTMLQATAIHALRKNGPINITQLAGKLHLNQSTVSSLVDRMERDGLVRRIQSSTDRRSVKLRLTDKADQIAERVNVSPFTFFKWLLRELSAEERGQLAGILEKLEGVLLERFDQFDKIRESQRPPPKTASG